MSFDEAIQLLLIEETLQASLHQEFRTHFIAADEGHVHVLASWKTDRTWKRVRSGLKQSLSRRLNRHTNRQDSLSEGGSRKRIKDRQHFDDLVQTYLPSHRGWKWQEGRGQFR